MKIPGLGSSYASQTKIQRPFNDKSMSIDIQRGDKTSLFASNSNKVSFLIGKTIMEEETPIKTADDSTKRSE
jgi:hypothetical protein